MIDRETVLNFLNDYLNIQEFTDYCVNGLQVEGCEDIERMATAVSLSSRCIEMAIQSKINLLIVHHGMFWKGSPHPFQLRGIMRDRLKLLLSRDISLAAYHLPLDAHPVIGNNARILKALNITPKEPVDVGWWGKLSSIPIDELKMKLDLELPDPSTLYRGKSDRISSVAVISGGASHHIETISRMGIDSFITGEMTEPAVRVAEECGIHVIAAGHYNTERFGPIALGELLESQFNTPVHFIDVPNPV